MKALNFLWSRWNNSNYFWIFFCCLSGFVNFIQIYWEWTLKYKVDLHFWIGFVFEYLFPNDTCTTGTSIDFKNSHGIPAKKFFNWKYKKTLILIAGKSKTFTLGNISSLQKKLKDRMNTIIISQHTKTNFPSSLYIQNSFKKISFISLLFVVHFYKHFILSP